MAVDLDKIVAVYTKIRDKRSELKKAFEKEDTGLKGKLEQLEGVLLNQLNTTKSDSTKTSHGTFYRQKDVMPSCSDWAAFYAWIKEHDAFDALERRVKKTFITDYMEEHRRKALEQQAEDGHDSEHSDAATPQLPPGISVYTKYVVRVRKN